MIVNSHQLFNCQITVKSVILYRWRLLSYLSILAWTYTQCNPIFKCFFLFFFTFLSALTFYNFLQKVEPIFIKVSFCRYLTKENFKAQLKIPTPYVALGSHCKGFFSTVHCQFWWHQSNKNSTHLYSQFGTFFHTMRYIKYLKFLTKTKKNR